MTSTGEGCKESVVLVQMKIVHKKIVEIMLKNTKIGKSVCKIEVYSIKNKHK